MTHVFGRNEINLFSSAADEIRFVRGMCVDKCYIDNFCCANLIAGPTSISPAKRPVVLRTHCATWCSDLLLVPLLGLKTGVLCAAEPRDPWKFCLHLCSESALSEGLIAALPYLIAQSSASRATSFLRFLQVTVISRQELLCNS